MELCASVVQAPVGAVRLHDRRRCGHPVARVEEGSPRRASPRNEIGIDRSYYGAIERAEHSATVDTLAMIAAGLGTSAWKLLRTAEV